MNENPDHGALYGGNPPIAIGQTPLIINACLSGNVTSRNVNPHVPTSIGEIVNNALEVIDAGVKRAVDLVGRALQADRTQAGIAQAVG